MCILEERLKGREHLLPRLDPDGYCACTFAEDVDYSHYEYVPLVLATQSWHVRQVRMALCIDPRDIGGVAFEETSGWFVERVTLLLCNEPIHLSARHTLQCCPVCAAEERFHASIEPRNIGVLL